MNISPHRCKEDTKGETCFICTRAVHWKTKEGLVRGCSCRGTAGVVHVSCLAEQAKILFAEAEENNLDLKVKDTRFERWFACGLCEQKYHGVVKCALGWACWKTYLGRAENDWVRGRAMNVLGNGLSADGQFEAALAVREADLATMRRFGAPEQNMLIAQSNLASTYQSLGRFDDALRMEREIYEKEVASLGSCHPQTLVTALCIANSLARMHKYDEVRSHAPARIPECQRVLGAEHENTLFLRTIYARALFEDDPEQAETILVDVTRIARRVLGLRHPRTVLAEGELRFVRAPGEFPSAYDMQ